MRHLKERILARRKDSGPAPRALPFDAIVTAAARRQRLNMTYALLGEVLGAHHCTVSLAVRRIILALHQHDIAPIPGTPKISDLARLREHATAAGITITGITHPHDTPETAN